MCDLELEFEIQGSSKSPKTFFLFFFPCHQHMVGQVLILFKMHPEI